MDWGGKGRRGEKLVSPEVVRSSEYILNKEPSTFYDRLNVMFEKITEMIKIFEPKQSKIETFKTLLL